MQLDVLVEVSVVGCSVISSNDTGQSVIVAEDVRTGGIGAAVGVEVVEQAVGQQKGVSIFQTHFLGDGSLADIAVRTESLMIMRTGLPKATR